MKKRHGLLIFCLPIALMVFSSQTASAADLTLQSIEWLFNIDGTVYDNPYGPNFVFPGTGNPENLGTVNLVVSGAGFHDVLGFFDREFVCSDTPGSPIFSASCPAGGNGFSNESAGINGGLPPVGLRWEIDEPGYGGGGYLGDIIGHANGASDASLDLDKLVFDGILSKEDVSAALGWHFNLGVGETAYLSFRQATTAPSGFYIDHYDTDDPVGHHVYYSTDLDIRGGTTVPEPSTMVMLAIGLTAFLSAAVRLKMKVE